MKIDEAIKHCEEVMMENLEKTKDRNASDPIAINCFECADEHRQLAEWLKELKAHREAWENVYRDIEQLTTILYESSCEGDWQYGIDKYDALDIIDKYRPKDGDTK